MSNTNAFADRLREAREKAGLSQYALAKKSGLSKQAISQLERGVGDPAWTTVQALALAIGIDCREFVDTSFALPDEVQANPPGRPRKAEEPAEEPKKRTRKKKGE